MYSDNTLTPRETIRLCALGTLAGNSIIMGQTMTYDDLAHAIRHFVSRITGPSLELMGESIELLRFEGLANTIENTDTSNPTLVITPSGISALNTLLLANIKSSNSDLNELVIALKFRFFHLLSAADQINQINLITDVCEVELARFEDLHDYHRGDLGLITGWLKHDINRLKTRLKWLHNFNSELASKS